MTSAIFAIFYLLALSLAYETDSVGDCGLNESLHICGRICEPSCFNRNPRFCPRLQCTKFTTRCRCKKGFFRDTVSKMCVPPLLCPDNRNSDLVKPQEPNFDETVQTCGDNEQLGSCGRICEGTCTNPDLAQCAATSCAGSGCQCKPGYLRDEATDRCVLASQCPKECQPGEIQAACGKTCEGTCASPVTPEICSRIRCANLDCRCDLGNGFVRSNVTGGCVQIDQCKNEKPKCPANSAPKLCGSVCEPTCSDPRERLCKVDPSKCTVDCRCSKGYVRNEKTNKCVRPDKCC